VNRNIFYFLVLVIFASLSARPVSAVTNPQSFTTSVSATIPDLSFEPPTLLTPAINAALNTTRPVFSWSRPSPLPALSPLSYYNFFLDGAVFAASISDSLTTQDYYFYTASASAGIFNLLLKTDLAQGYHTWSVIAFTENGISSASETRNFYIDSIPPFISVTKIDRQSLSWNTATPGSIPPVENRYLTVTTKDPIIKGDVESFSNFQIILICPQNIPKCEIQVFTGNISSGHWETHFSDLLPNQIYTIKISATDPSGNSTIFPDFFITYPVSLLLALPSIPISPPIELLNVITPTSYVPATPPAPMLPPAKKVTTIRPMYPFYLLLLILIVFGLPLHLLMASIGTATPLRFALKFIVILAFPFLRRKTYQTIPFSFINVFIPDKLDHPWQSTVSDVQGFYDLRSPIPDNIFIEMSAVGRPWKNNLLRGSLMAYSCLCPRPTTPQNNRTRLRKRIYTARIIPLVIALTTSTTAIIITPSYSIFIYAYFSLQYLFSEYLYPKI